MTYSSSQNRKSSRNRKSYYLSDVGYKKIWEAINYKFRDQKPTNNDIADQTLEKDQKSVSSSTVGNIINRGEVADIAKIKALFMAFGLRLESEDLTQDPPLPIPEPDPFDPNFVGREKAIADLHNLTQQHKLILIHAGGGIGKTELGKKYLKNQGFDKVIEFLMAKTNRASVASIEGEIERWINEEFGQEPARDFMINLGRLRKLLESQKVGILIDNLEPALDNGKFIEPHRNYVELLRILGEHDGQSITLITSREKLAESGIKIKIYSLEGLTGEAWKDYFNYHNIKVDQPTLKAMRDAYGGNAKAMTIIAGAITEDNEGDMVRYWEANKSDLLVKLDLKDLVETQFERLQEHDIDAYHLLCRLGCYRYQDVPTVPTEGLFCLLWDVKDNKQRVIERLKSRALIEHKNGEYWLHPVIKQEAVERLKNSEDWETANRQAAKFWTDSVKIVETVNDALRALEAYYHYVDIEDYEKAGSVITNNRNNQDRKYETLGASFYRIGLFNQIIIHINRIVNKVKGEAILVVIYNILGYSQELNGNILESIESHKKCRDYSIKIQDNHSQSLAYFNLGLCFIALGEIQKAKEYFEKVILLCSSQTNLRELETSASAFFCMAFLCSCLKKEYEAIQFINKFDSNQELAQSTYWNKGYSHLFIALTYNNLGYISQSFEQYQQALKFAEESYYLQVKAKALTGIGELYRIKKDYNQAIKNHEESIEILEELGAKCDLAEAYYQLALTYQEMGKIVQSQVYFEKAIELFTQIDAPKQIERVKNSIIKDK